MDYTDSMTGTTSLNHQPTGGKTMNEDADNTTNDIPTTLNAASGQTVTPAAAAIAPRCVDLRGLARMLAVGAHTIIRMDDGGQLPPPMRFGETGKRGRKVWLIADIDWWLTHGRPSREKFVAMRRLS